MAIDPETRALIKTNGAKGADRLAQLLEDDANFHHRDENGEFVKGKLSGKEQIAIAVVAMDRAFGKSESINISHTHGGTVGMNLNADKLKNLADRLPERIAQQRVIDADPVQEAEVVDREVAG